MIMIIKIMVSTINIKNSYELITAFILNGFSLLWWLTFFIAYYFFQKKKNTDVNNLKSTLSALWINIVGVGNQPENCTNDNNNDTDDQQKNKHYLMIGRSNF